MKLTVIKILAQQTAGNYLYTWKIVTPPPLKKKPALCRPLWLYIPVARKYSFPSNPPALCRTPHFAHAVVFGQTPAFELQLWLQPHSTFHIPDTHKCAESQMCSLNPTHCIFLCARDSGDALTEDARCTQLVSRNVKTVVAWIQLHETYRII